MDFVGPPDWDVVAQHVGYAAMVLSTLFVVGLTFGRLLDRWDSVVTQLRRQRPQEAREIETPPPCAKGLSAGDETIAVDEVAPPIQVHVPSQTAWDRPRQKPRKKRRQRDWLSEHRSPAALKGQRGDVVEFRLPTHVYKWLLAVDLPFEAYSEKDANERAYLILKEFVDVAQRDPTRAVDLPRRARPSAESIGCGMTVRLSGETRQSLELIMDAVEWPKRLREEFYSAIVAHRLDDARPKRRTRIDNQASQ